MLGHTIPDEAKRVKDVGDTPQITYAFVADSHKRSESGKLDVQGIFNSIGIWAAPARREFSLVVGIQDVPTGHTVYSLWFRRRGSRAQQLGKFEIDARKVPEILTVAERVPITFSELGTHEIGVAKGPSLKGARVRWIPINIHSFPWPDLPSGEELKRLLRKPDVVKAARALLTCEACGTTYIFQKNLDPTAELDEEALPFPETGEFRCPECDSVHYTRDIEGQVISQLGKSTQGRG